MCKRDNAVREILTLSFLFLLSHDPSLDRIRRYLICVWLDQPLLPAINHLCLATVCLELGKPHPPPPPIPDFGKLPTILVERTIIQSHALFSNCFCIFNEVISYLVNSDGSKFSHVHPGLVLRLEKGRAEPAF